MEQDPWSAWRSSRAKLLLSAADGEPGSGLECKVGGAEAYIKYSRKVTALIYYAIRNAVCLLTITVLA